MIIRTKRVKSEEPNGESESMMEIKSSNKPGMKFKQKIVKSYNTKVKPGIKNAVSEAKSDFQEMIFRK